MITIRLGSFSNSLIDTVARRTGMYRDEFIDVEFCRVLSSPSQFEKLSNGEIDVALTATDNVLNYRYNQSPGNTSSLDIRIIRGVELSGGVSLVAGPTVQSLQDLRGALIAVDDTNSGFALLLYELLARAGLVRGLDYDVVVFGGTPRRFKGVVDGEVDATMLHAGFDLRAADHGCSILGTVSDALPRYMTTVLAALPAWLEGESAPQQFLRAWDRAAVYAKNPVNSQACIDMIQRHFVVTEQLATRMYKQATDPQFGLMVGGGVSRSGVSEVAHVRRRHGELGDGVDIAAALQEPFGLIDQRYARVFE
ncbi:ABC transporter substrate-binding protein [Streptomyces sp. NPDC048448]|uniref:ABC transporter substrate-binding protein n=1 Tax=Streptomyces sp. NPDC048448 TaxID=3365554 RepID=UPI003720011A